MNPSVVRGHTGDHRGETLSKSGKGLGMAIGPLFIGAAACHTGFHRPVLGASGIANTRGGRSVSAVCYWVLWGELRHLACLCAGRLGGA